MTGFNRSATGALRGILDELSRLLEGTDLWSDEAADALARIHDAIAAEQLTSGKLSLRVRPNGALSINGIPVAAGRSGALGRVLANAGVRELDFMPGLEPEHLTRFIQTVGLVGETASGPESDLVTYWSEQGDDTVRIRATDLEIPTLHQGPPRDLPELDHIRALFAPRDERSDIARDWPRVTGLLLGGALEKPLLGQPPDDQAREAIHLTFAPLDAEDEASLRRQFLATLLAATSVQVPALQPRDYTFLAQRVVTEQLLDHHWDDVTRTTRNLEFLLDPTSAVAEHTRAAARLCIERLHSAATLQRLVIACSEGDPPPFRVVRWFIGDAPLPLWREAATRIDLQHLEGLVALFSICFAFEHPFWSDAVDALPQDRATLVRNVIANLETRWLDDYEASPAAAARRNDTSSNSNDSILGWDDFDLDQLEENDANELDASLIAFLDASDSSLGPTRTSTGANRRSQSAPRRQAAVASAMLDELDALERSLAPGAPSSSSPPPRKGGSQR